MTYTKHNTPHPDGPRAHRRQRFPKRGAGITRRGTAEQARLNREARAARIREWKGRRDP